MSGLELPPRPDFGEPPAEAKRDENQQRSSQPLGGRLPASPSLQLE